MPAMDDLSDTDDTIVFSITLSQAEASFIKKAQEQEKASVRPLATDDAPTAPPPPSHAFGEAPVGAARPQHHHHPPSQEGEPDEETGIGGSKDYPNDYDEGRTSSLPGIVIDNDTHDDEGNTSNDGGRGCRSECQGGGNPKKTSASTMTTSATAPREVSSSSVVPPATSHGHSHGHNDSDEAAAGAGTAAVGPGHHNHPHPHHHKKRGPRPHIHGEKPNAAVGAGAAAPTSTSAGTGGSWDEVVKLLNSHQEKLTAALDAGLKAQERTLERLLGEHSPPAPAFYSSAPLVERQPSGISSTSEPGKGGRTSVRAFSGVLPQSEATSNLGDVSHLRRSSTCKTSRTSRGTLSRKVSWEALSYDMETMMTGSLKQGIARTKTTLPDLSFWGRTQTAVRGVVQHSAFEGTCAFLISSNALLIGLEAAVLASEYMSGSPLWIEALQFTYFFAFLVELALRLVAYGRGFFTSGQWFWNWLDFFIVGCSIFDYGVNLLNAHGEISGGMATIVSMSRVARLMRILRMTRLMFFVRGLQIMVHSILATFKTLGWAVCLMVLILYVYAVLFTMVAAEYLQYTSSSGSVDEAALTRHWGSLHASMYSLFKAITEGESWSEMMSPLLEIHVAWAATFISFIVLTQFAVLNVMTGLFCNAAIEQATAHRELKVQEVLEKKQEYMAQIAELFQELDTDESGNITVQEFARLMSDNRLQAFFTSLELDPGEVSVFFKLLDENGSKDIDLEEFITGCLRLRGGARAVDLASLRYESRWLMKTFVNFANRVEENFHSLMERWASESMSDRGSESPQQSSLLSGSISVE